MFTLLTGKLKQLFQLPGDNPLTRQIVRRTIALTAAFLLISPFVPFYQLTEGNNNTDGTDTVDFTDQETDFALNDMMTEDGFLLKPALNTTAGDRSTVSDIFAYTVEPGDTLSSLAQRFGIKKETLIAENDLWNTSGLRIGSTLKILPVDGISYLVQKGDTLDKIAKKYNVDKALLVKQNQLEGDALASNTALIIPGATKEAPMIASAGGSSHIPSQFSGGHTSAYLAHRGPSGTAPEDAPGSEDIQAAGKLIWPTAPGATLTQKFHKGHYALDIANRNHGPIYAAADGKVVKASYGWNGGYGNYIIIDHGNGMQTLYGHNEKLYVTEGQYVTQGQTISWMGNSGRVHGATGIHVHFEVRINGVKYDPMKFF